VYITIQVDDVAQNHHFMFSANVRVSYTDGKFEHNVVIPDQMAERYVYKMKA